MSRRSRLHVKLAAAAVAVSCAAGGAAVAATRSHPDRSASLADVAARASAQHAAALGTGAARPRGAQVGLPKTRPAKTRGAANSAAATGSATNSGATNSGATTDVAGAQAAPAATPANFKKGVSAWAFPGMRPALRKSGASWYYTWTTTPNGVNAPKSVKFVPMIWGAGAVTPAALAQAKAASHIMLTFNEPDNAGQSNMTVAQALSLWPQLEATGMRLSSPAVASGGATPGGWLDQFMQGAAARHYRVSFITLHWYGGNFQTAAAVSELRSYIQAVWNRYHKPIWLTEFALIRFGATSTFPTPARQAAFLTRATAMLQKLPYVWRYAWFALPKTTGANGDGSTGLFANGAVPTAAGRAFEKVDA
jgi:Glycosyl hydrolase catalytic core